MSDPGGLEPLQGVFVHSPEVDKVSAALVKAQGQIKAVRKSGYNPHFKSRYADISDVLEEIHGPYDQNGLALVQFPISNDVGAGVYNVVLHESGQYLACPFILPSGKKDAQGYAGCVTYARRYSAEAINKIASQDDDGNTASEKEPKKTKEKPATIEDLRAEIKRIGGDVEQRVLTKANAKSIEDLSADHIGRLVVWMRQQKPNGGAA